MAKSEASSKDTKPERFDPKGARIKSYLVGAIRKSDAGAALDAALEDSESESDEYIGFYQNAEILMDQISDGSYTVGRLPVYQKKLIFFYLSVFHPTISRIISLHTKLPLSSLRIQKPDHPVDIVQDYVFDYFERLMEDSTFKGELKKAVKNYWTFGEGPVQIEDDFHFKKDTLVDLDDLTLPELPEEQRLEMERINNEYNTDPDSVTWKQKLQVLEKYLLNVNKDYKGIHRIRALFPLFIENTSFNEDVDYWLYTLKRSKPLMSLLANSSLTKSDGQGGSVLDYDKIKKLGYSRALVELTAASESSFIQVDNDPFNEDGMYIARLASEENTPVDSSLINSVLESAVQNMLAIRKSNVLVSLSSKIDRLVSAPKASQDQLDQLNEDLALMAENPEGAVLAVNFQVDVEELALDIKDSLDLNDTIDRTGKEILSSLGMPEELISGEGTYGSGFLKVELLTNEYVEFRNSLKGFIENQIFKPIAIKKGFVTLDSWGNVVPLIPKVRFDKFSISRSSEDLSQMMSLVSDGHLPVEVLLEHMGFTVEDIEQKLLRQTSSMFNRSIQDLIDSAISQLDDRLLENPEFIERIMQALSLNKDEVTGLGPREE